jgi:hypothetical protein
MGLEYNALRAGSERWASLSELLEETARDLGSAPTSGLAPECQGAAWAFLRAWEGNAGESAATADGFSTALEEVAARTAATDSGTRGDMEALDSRLGPAR